jgi:hypothetical protein
MKVHCAVAIDQGCDNSEAAAEGEANARKLTAVLPHVFLAAYGLRISILLLIIRVKLLQNKLQAVLHLLHLSVLRLQCI